MPVYRYRSGFKFTSRIDIESKGNVEHMFSSVQSHSIESLRLHKVDLWTSILEQEHLLTESLMKSHMEQLQALTRSENLAVKRCQMDVDNRSAYLSVTLEANQRVSWVLLLLFSLTLLSH
ncbi:unnamed protein product [Trichobilharzia regenti]|nr:unnamed protein product [Trichobilharzia regenti]